MQKTLDEDDQVTDVEILCPLKKENMSFIKHYDGIEGSHLQIILDGTAECRPKYRRLFRFDSAIPTNP